MFTRKPTEVISLEKSIDEAARSLDPFQENYQTMISSIERLTQVREKYLHSSRISPDTKLIVAGNLAGILLILYFEKMNVITSKALSFVLKIK